MCPSLCSRTAEPASRTSSQAPFARPPWQARSTKRREELARVAPTSLGQQEENIMEFLVEFELEVPAGTPQPEVEQCERAECTVAANLAARTASAAVDLGFPGAVGDGGDDLDTEITAP